MLGALEVFTITALRVMANFTGATWNIGNDWCSFALWQHSLRKLLHCGIESHRWDPIYL